MTSWQRRARLVLAVFAVAFAVLVVFAMKRRGPQPPASVKSARSDPQAVVESTSGRVMRFKRTHEDVTIEYDHQLAYADGSAKLVGVRVESADRHDGRTFTLTAKEGRVGPNEAEIALTGDVELVASDGLTMRTEHATYADRDATVRAAGPVQFSRNKLSGSGVGMTYDKNRDVLALLDQAVVHLKADPHGSRVDIVAGSATFARREKSITFDRMLHTVRGGQTIDAATGVAHLTDNEERLTRVELHGGARVSGSAPDPGALESLSGADMELNYAPDGETLDHVSVVGDAVLRVAGQRGQQGRQIAASTLDIALAPDGVTPIALHGAAPVRVVFPPDQETPARTITAKSLEAGGQPGKGLTRALLTDDVDFRELGTDVARVAKAGILELALKPGMSAVEEARFERGVRFEEGKMEAQAAIARYAIDKGTVELSGSEPRVPHPRVVTDQIDVTAKHIDLTLAGPKMAAKGDVRSIMRQPPKDGQAAGSETKLPSMLKPDQAVNVLGDSLDYDGTASKAVFTGAAKLWQPDISIQGKTITIDSKTGDLDASGSVATSMMMEQVGKDKVTKERVRSLGTAHSFKYEESGRRATYLDEAHLSGPQGDMTASKIELYLKPSGDELDRAEGYEKLTLREPTRKTTGARLTYTTADELYRVTGSPVSVIDECGRETLGAVLTFNKAADTINVDGKGQVRTQTRGGGKCP
jgi:LPS export ABC transporter protein LptC